MSKTVQTICCLVGYLLTLILGTVAVVAAGHGQISAALGFAAWMIGFPTFLWALFLFLDD